MFCREENKLANINGRDGNGSWLRQRQRPVNSQKQHVLARR